MVHRTTATNGHKTATNRHKPNAAVEVIAALSMTVGRRKSAEALARLADVGAHDRVVDVGCGPGAAVRGAVRRGAKATGVDPSPIMLRLARLVTNARRYPGAAWLEGSAESIPLPDGVANVVWSISSFHHWADQSAGLAEVHRVLAPSGRALIAERLTRPGARGHAAHGLTRAEADQLVVAFGEAGFGEVQSQVLNAGRRTLVVVTGQANPSPVSDN
jgi:ubiquinone/menaquinone biosynthesis C-methylase UbiE